MTSRALLWVLIGALGLAVLVAAARSEGLAAGNLGPEDLASLVGLSVLAAVIGASVLRRSRGRAGEAFQAAVGWIAIVAFLAVIYTYRFEFEAIGRRLAGNLVPGIGQDGTTGPREVTIPRGSGGAYVARVEVNGARAVPMIVDTGASAVVLTDADARRAGIRVDDLTFNIPVQTANGQAMTAAVTLSSVSLGPITERGVRAFVARARALSTSLLGHTFLDRLESYEVRGGRMVLRGRP